MGFLDKRLGSSAPTSKSRGIMGSIVPQAYKEEGKMVGFGYSYLSTQPGLTNGERTKTAFSSCSRFLRFFSSSV
jgi:predicted GNAT superfamily acetyltransferase